MVSPLVNCSRKREGSASAPALGFVFAIALAVFSLCAPGSVRVHGDEIWLKNGHQITGKICESGRHHLLIEVPEGTIRLQRHLVDYVVRMPANDSMLAECRRRLQGGFPGSALPWLRKEYIHHPDLKGLLPLYRECLVAELKLELEKESVETALTLWNEVVTLPGSDPEVSQLRPLVLKEQSKLLQMEKEILLCIERGESEQVIDKLKELALRYPSESISWLKVFEEQSRLAALKYLERSDFPALQQTLEKLLQRSTRSWPFCRSALTLAWIENEHGSLAEALTWLPDSAALHLALANESAQSDHPLGMTPHLKKVSHLVGGEIDALKIREELSRTAMEELRGEISPAPLVQDIAAEWFHQFWDRFAFAGSPPRIPVIIEHASVEELDQHLGSPGGPVRLESISEYGQVQKLTLHVVRDIPFLCQDQLPRELFRALIDTALETPRCPPWLQEGLSARARGPLARARDRFLLNQAREHGRLPDVRDLVEMGHVDHEVHRAACGAIVDQLLETTPRALIPLRLQQIRDLGLEAFLRSTQEIDTLHKLQQRWVGDLVDRRG